ncbi:MAG: NAD-dependent deacylase [Calditrichaeota bacterium]|nr:NAD-dependent deacylase [Calditrichota bacterium]MCB9366415.1 NAD-dependent deacylase [Calditrichota bacterium]
MLPQSLSESLGKLGRIAVLTGAGISADSGLGTFRGKDGIWNKMRPEELASMEGFLANPQLVWEWYTYRRSLLAAAEPNPGHKALAEWQGIHPDFTLITQNVDGLHQLAGSKNVLELHGSIRVNRCLNCGSETENEPQVFKDHVPYCSCGGRLRPGVVWFGEMLSEATLTSAFEAAQTCDLFLTIGTSAAVYPAASLPEIASAHGAVTVEVNIEETAFTRLADFHFAASASVAVPMLLDAWLVHHPLSILRHEK